MKNFGIATFIAVLCVSAAFADSSPIVAWSFHTMDGDYDGGSTLTANAQSGTRGQISRVVPVTGDAYYAAGWFEAATFANVSMTFTVNNITATTADGTGSFVFTDADGDTFSASMVGNWTNDNGTAKFDGEVANAWFTDNGAADGTFDGPSFASNFLMSFLAPPPFNGTTQSLTVGAWFTNGAGVKTAFSNVNTQTTGAIVPLPGAALLGMVGFGAVSWIRRRLS